MMSRWFLCAVWGLLVVVMPMTINGGEKKQTPKQKKEYKSIGKIEQYDKGLSKILNKKTKIQVIVDGHVWTEGPCWVPSGKYLLFSDIPRNAVYKWKGKDTLFLKNSGYSGKEPRGGEDGKDEPGSNGIVLAPDGEHIILCQHGDRRVVKMNLKKKGKFTVLADKYMGKRLNSPNDAVFDAKGNLYFTDPPYGLPQREKDPARELDFFGVYKVDTDGKLTLMTKEMTRPNGIAISGDGKMLIVANSDPKLAIWKAFPINDDGTLGKSKVILDVTDKVGKMPGLPDGMVVDAKGNLFATGPGGCYVFDSDFKLLGLIYTGERTSNATLGGINGNALFLTTDDYVTRVFTKTKAKGFE